MKHTYLEVTYRKGRPIAAYYYLPRESGDTSARTEQVGGGLVIDFEAGGRAIGIEIVSPARIELSQLNHVLNQFGFEPVSREDIAPLKAA